VLALKTELALNFPSQGIGRRPSASYATDHTVGDMQAAERLIARHALTNTGCDRLLSAIATRREEA